MRIARVAGTLFALGAVTLVCIACSATPQNGASGNWTKLFNGKNLDGWEKHGGTAEFTVEDGTIVGESKRGTPNTFLCTTSSYGDFELQFEVKVHNKLNSGVQIRSGIQGEDEVYGPQVEIEASPGDAGYIYSEKTDRGWLSTDRSKKNVFENNEWNQYRVVAKGPRIQTWINGQKVADVTDQKSRRKGFIGLQVHSVSHGFPIHVRWRDLRIRELDADRSK